MPNETAARAAPLSANHTTQRLSPRWCCAHHLAFGLSVLILLTTKVYHDAPPIPDKMTDSDGSDLFNGKDIGDGQVVFLKYALMDNGSIWGHGALLGPDFRPSICTLLRCIAR